MFLHLSVILSLDLGGVSASGSEGVYTPCSRHPLGRHPQGATLSLRRHPTPGIHPLPETVTAADGTHSTGIHSCCLYDYSLILYERLWK